MAPPRARFDSTRLSLAFVLIALFTASWDRLGVVMIGTFSLKIPVISSLLALALHIYDVASERVSPLPRGPRTMVTVAVSGVVGATVLAIVMSVDPTVSAVQSGTIILGAVVPYLAVASAVRSISELRRALTAFVWGGYAACVFGVYQLIAYYTGLPQLIEYRALSGGLARISSFSYEAGYFGYFLILVIAAQVGRSFLVGLPLRLLPTLAVVAVIVLSNTRATLFTVPLLVIVVVVGWPRRLPRPKLGGLVAALLPWLVVGLVIAWPVVVTLFQRALTAFDPNEESSNAPRIEVAGAALRVIRENPLWGVGPGNFGEAASRYTDLATGPANRAIVNNVWLQALVDGGPILLVAQASLVGVTIIVALRWASPTARALTAGWLSVLVVCSWITSYFFDIKLWLVLGLVVAALSAAKERRPSPGFEPCPAIPAQGRGRRTGIV